MCPLLQHPSPHQDSVYYQEYLKNRSSHALAHCCCCSCTLLFHQHQQATPASILVCIHDIQLMHIFSVCLLRHSLTWLPIHLQIQLGGSWKWSHWTQGAYLYYLMSITPSIYAIGQTNPNHSGTPFSRLSAHSSPYMLDYANNCGTCLPKNVQRWENGKALNSIMRLGKITHHGKCAVPTRTLPQFH